MKISHGTLPESLTAIARHPEARAIMLDALKRIERALARPDLDVREMIAGPIVDAMHAEQEPISKELSDGTVFICRYTSKIIRDFVMSEDEKPDHVWEPQTTRAAVALASRGGNIVVGGAYIGDHAILIARSLGTRGVVHCFEPSVQSAELLKANAAANDITNIVLNRQGLWSENVSLILEGQDSLQTSAISSHQGGGSFSATSIDAYGKSRSIERISFLLLDIEGAEIEALKGATRYLSQLAEFAPNIIFEVHKSYVDWTAGGLRQTAIVKLLEGFGYHVFALRDYNSNVPMASLPIEIVDLDTVYLEGPPHGFNLVAVKDQSQLSDQFRKVSGVSPKLLKHRAPELHAPLFEG